MWGIEVVELVFYLTECRLIDNWPISRSHRVLLDSYLLSQVMTYGIQLINLFWVWVSEICPSILLFLTISTLYRVIPSHTRPSSVTDETLPLVHKTQREICSLDDNLGSFIMKHVLSLRKGESESLLRVLGWPRPILGKIL